jgi:hypothetical protein
MRVVTAHAFIQLPGLDASETVSLIHKLEAQGKTGDASVPAAAAESFDTMLTARDALQAATPAAAAEGKGTAVRDAHFAVQHAWGALERWLGGFTALDDDDDPRVPAAKKLYATLFGEGLGFINHKIEAEWPESDRKIAAVKHAHLAKSFTELGAPVFWTKVVAAHGLEGAAAHLTTATPAGGTPADQRVKMLAAQDAIREYVAHIIGTVKRSKPATQEAADELLRPLAEWPSHPHAAPASEPAPAAPPPAGLPAADKPV